MQCCPSGETTMKPVKCMNPKCENTAYVNIDGLWLCGECILKYIKKKSEKAKQILKEL